MLLIAAFVAMAVLLSPSGALAQDGTEAVYEYDFGSDAEGWTFGFADLPVDFDQSIFELDHGHRPLPDGLEGSGVYVQGHNRSDDLFMFGVRLQQLLNQCHQPIELFFGKPITVGNRSNEVRR